MNAIMGTTHTDPNDVAPNLMSPLQPHVIVLFGAAGDLSRRKLLPGLMHLWQTGLLPECRIVATSLEELDDDGFRNFARAACEEFSAHPFTDDEWVAFAKKMTYVVEAAGAEGLAERVAWAEKELGGEPRRLHYLSVPPKGSDRGQDAR